MSNTGSSAAQAKPSGKGRGKTTAKASKAPASKGSAKTTPVPAPQPARPPSTQGQPTTGETDQSLVNRDTPALLRRWQILATAICLAFALLTGGQLALAWQANRAAAADTEQLALVSDIQSTLFRADALATNAFLVGGLEPASQRAAYDAAMSRVSAEIAQASAAQPADRAALAALSQKVLVYAEGIQQARANNRQGLPVGAQYLKESSAQLRSEALPIANALVGANRARAESEMSANSPGLVAVFGALALGGLFLINRQMAAAFRRQVNLGVAAAALAVLVTTVAAVWLSAVKDNNVTTLRQGDFKVAVAAAAARTAGNDARSNEALRLIARGSGAAFEAAWVEAAATTTDRLAQVGQTDAQDPWDRYRRAHDTIVQLDTNGSWDKAVAQATTNTTNSATEAFNAFDAKTQILAGSASTTVAKGVVANNWLVLTLAVLSGLVGLAASGLVAWGIGQRRREFG